MSALSNIVLAYKIAQKFEAKSKAQGQSFTPEFSKALDSFLEGDTKPMQELLQRVLDCVFPDRKLATWFSALGTGKQTTLKKLVKEAEFWLRGLSKDPASYTHTPEQAKQFHLWQAGQLKDWAKGLRALELATQAEDQTQVLKVGDFEVIPMPGLKAAEVKEAIGALEAAAHKIQPVFPEVLYGKVYLSTHLSSTTHAKYTTPQDVVFLSVRAKSSHNSIYAIIHELGHRFDLKFASSALRKEFEALSPTHPVSPYGAKDSSENFAEAFAHYVLGEPLAPEISSIFDRLK